MSDAVASPILREIANFAYCEIPEAKPKVTDKTRTLFRNRLTSAFTLLLSDLRGFSYPCQLLQSFTPSAVPMDHDITKAKDKSLGTMEKLLKKAKKADDGEKAPLQALALLYSLVIFQLYNGEPEAISIFDELKVCYDKLIRNRKEEEEEDDAEASEVLVELLLSFISKPSALLRRVAQHVFSAFMDNVTAGGLKLMTDVLESSESLRGQQEMFDQEPEDGEQLEEDGEEGSDSDELDSDVEIIDVGVEGGGDDDDDDDEEEEDEEEEDDDEGEDDAEVKKLEEALAKALGTRRLDEAAAEDEEESDSDADMTDSEMMELDDKLVEIFKHRKKQPNKKQEQKEAKETMVNFKSRILDLLDIYVKKQASNPLAFQLLLPLLQLMRTTRARQLAEKAHGIILAFSKAAKKVDAAAADVKASAQLKLLKAIHGEAAQDPSHMFAKGASTASLLVASSAYRVDKESIAKIATVYRDSQVAWVEGRVKMQAIFFTEWVNWCQSHANSEKS